MIDINDQLQPSDLLPKLATFWDASAECIGAIEKSCPPGSGSPVFTVEGRYTAKGWTEWTQGFQYGSALLQFDATGDERFLDLGRQRTLEVMAPHLTHVGVHDHGFNNVSTYGNLWRLMKEGRVAEDARQPWRQKHRCLQAQQEERCPQRIVSQVYEACDPPRDKGLVQLIDQTETDCQGQDSQDGVSEGPQRAGLKSAIEQYGQDPKGADVVSKLIQSEGVVVGYEADVEGHDGLSEAEDRSSGAERDQRRPRYQRRPVADQPGATLGLGGSYHQLVLEPGKTGWANAAKR